MYLRIYDEKVIGCSKNNDQDTCLPQREISLFFFCFFTPIFVSNETCTRPQHTLQIFLYSTSKKTSSTAFSSSGHKCVHKVTTSSRLHFLFTTKPAGRTSKTGPLNPEITNDDNFGQLTLNGRIAVMRQKKGVKRTLMVELEKCGKGWIQNEVRRRADGDVDKCWQIKPAFGSQYWHIVGGGSMMEMSMVKHVKVQHAWHNFQKFGLQMSQKTFYLDLDAG